MKLKCTFTLPFNKAWSLWAWVMGRENCLLSAAECYHPPKWHKTQLLWWLFIILLRSYAWMWPVLIIYQLSAQLLWCIVSRKIQGPTLTILPLSSVSEGEGFLLALTDAIQKSYNKVYRSYWPTKVFYWPVCLYNFTLGFFFPFCTSAIWTGKNVFFQFTKSVLSGHLQVISTCHRRAVEFLFNNTQDAIQPQLRLFHWFQWED